MRRLRILAQAAEEAAEAVAWYESERVGLGIEFQSAVEAVLDLIEQSVVPLTSLPGEPSAHGAKRLVLRRFPYSVIVREVSNEILVVAFAHHSRRPGYWRDRVNT